MRSVESQRLERRAQTRTALHTSAIKLLDSGTLLMLKRSAFSLRSASGFAPIHHWCAATSAITSPWNGARVSATQS